MDKISGKITKIDMSEGGQGDKTWTRYAYTINDKKYSTFDKEIQDNFNMGDDVTITGEQSGQYWNMKNMTAMETATESNPNPLVSNGTDDLLRQILAELKEMNNAKPNETIKD
jgi:hypothetical protein